MEINSFLGAYMLVLQLLMPKSSLQIILLNNLKQLFYENIDSAIKCREYISKFNLKARLLLFSF